MESLDELGLESLEGERGLGGADSDRAAAFLRRLSELRRCPGGLDPIISSLLQSGVIEPSTQQYSVLDHDFGQSDSGTGQPVKETLRAAGCRLLLPAAKAGARGRQRQRCIPCRTVRDNLRRLREPEEEDAERGPGELGPEEPEAGGQGDYLSRLKKSSLLRLVRQKQTKLAALSAEAGDLRSRLARKVAKESLPVEQALEDLLTAALRGEVC